MNRGASSAKHEKFEIQDSTMPNRKKIIRQDRIEVEDDSCSVLIRGSHCRVSNYSAFGLAVETPQPLEIGQELENVVFISGGFEIANLHLKTVRVEKADDLFYIGFEIVGEPINTHRVAAIQCAKNVIAKQAEESSLHKEAPPAFRQYVLEAKDWLDKFEGKIDAVENSANHDSSSETTAFFDTITQVVGEHFAEYFHPIFQQMAVTMKSFNEEQTKASVEFFRDRLKQYIYQAPFADRSYRKPLGYAGDYEMMNIIYRNEAAGQSLFAQCLHRFFVSEPAAKAVRNRSDYLCAKIVETFKSANPSKPLKFLSIASGPAFEVEKFLRVAKAFNGQAAEFHLLDQDENSLKYAQRRLEKLRRELGLNFEIKLFNQAIKNVITRGVAEGGYDLVYSAGLFDYFSDPVAQIAAQKLMNAVAPGGRLTIGNFDVSNPTRFLMELVLDWQLLYRSEEDMKRLFSQIPGQMTIEREGMGINLFCVIRK